eukprot:IDg21519t1
MISCRIPGTFPLTLDMATHTAVGYLDIRVRLCWNGRLHNFHLLAIPIYDRHTGVAMFNALAKAFDALNPHRRSTVFDILTDGEKKMNGCHQGLATRVLSVVKPGFMRVWFGAHQMDLCMQSFYIAMPDNFYRKLTLFCSLISVPEELYH